MGAQDTSIYPSCDGHSDRMARKKQSVFACPWCSRQDTAELNASVNVADHGLLYVQNRRGLTNQ